MRYAGLALLTMSLALLSSCEWAYDLVYPRGTLVIINESENTVVSVEVSPIDADWPDKNLLDEPVLPDEEWTLRNIPKLEYKVRLTVVGSLYVVPWTCSFGGETDWRMAPAGSV